MTVQMRQVSVECRLLTVLVSCMDTVLFLLINNTNKTVCKLNVHKCNFTHVDIHVTVAKVKSVAHTAQFLFCVDEVLS